MALLWCDGFDHYGLDEAKMLDGVYATANTEVVNLSTAQFATGTHSVVFSAEADLQPPALRKVLPTSKDKMGIAARYYFPSLPTGNTMAIIAMFCASDPTQAQVACICDANGTLRFYRGLDFAAGSNPDVGTLIAQTDPILTAAAWNHVEIQVYIHDTAGWIRVAVNGVHRYASATTLDTKHNTDNIVSVAHSNFWDQSASATWYMDDLYYYDFVGSSATDTDFVPATDGSGVATNYIGELQVIYLPVNGDTAQMQWVASSGTDEYAMIDETTPNDADYVYSTTAADLSEFALTDLPVDITYIRGVQLLGRMSKSDSGAAMTKFGMKSVAATSDAAERSITVAPTYWWDFMNVDPNSSSRWTRTSLNAAWFRLTRSL